LIASATFSNQLEMPRFMQCIYDRPSGLRLDRAPYKRVTENFTRERVREGEFG
jgi:hypothetical protein